MAVRIKGGPELRARLAAVVANAPEMERAWATDASGRIKRDSPRRTGRGAMSIKPGASRGRGAVFGAFWLIFVDRGTKAHAIVARKAQALKFEYRGRTIFTKKVMRKRMARRPFITKNAQEALQGLPIREQIIQAWNRKSGKGRFTRL